MVIMRPAFSVNPPGRRNQIEKTALANRRVGPGTIDLSHHRDGLRGGLVHENGNVRAADKASIFQPLLDQLLRFIGSQAGNVNIVDQGKVDVSGTADARLEREFGHSEHIDLDQIADAQLHIGIREQTRRIGAKLFRWQVRTAAPHPWPVSAPEGGGCTKQQKTRTQLRKRE